MNIPIKIWIWLSIGLPAVFGLLFLFNPQMPIQSTGAVGLAYMVGIRQLVFAGVTAVAALRLTPATIALLLGGRGLTDVADGIATLALSGVGPMAFAPIVAGFISLGVAYAVLRQQRTSTAVDRSPGLP